MINIIYLQKRQHTEIIANFVFNTKQMTNGERGNS